MKAKTQRLKLVEKGLSLSTVKKLTESQVEILYSRLISEQTGVTRVTKPVQVTTISQSALKSPQGVSVDGQQAKMDSAGNVVFTKTSQTEEIGEDENVDLYDDPDATEDGMGIFEEDDEKNNPWSICTSEMGKEFGTTKRSEWTPSQKRKYERCVKGVKKSMKEGKNPVSLYLENQIVKIVEKNLPPRITKGDLIKYLHENSPAVAPTKPKTTPQTKPGKPSVRPSHPGKNPRPGVKPEPKAISPDKAKSEVIDLIINLLEK